MDADALRNKAFAYAFFIQFLSAVPTVALMSRLLVPMTILGLSGWRWVIILGALCSLVIWVIRKNCRNPPGWKAKVATMTRTGLWVKWNNAAVIAFRRHASPAVAVPQRSRPQSDMGAAVAVNAPSC